MSLNSRLLSLERNLGADDNCPRCDGRGWSAVVVVASLDDPGNPEGCPVCGKVSCVKRIVMASGSLEGMEPFMRGRRYKPDDD